MGKGPKKDLKSMVFSLVWQNQSIKPRGQPPFPPPLTVKDRAKCKNKEVEGKAEKLSPQDKAPQTNNPDNNKGIDIEITEIIPPKDTSKICANQKPLESFIKVLGIIGDLTPTVENNEPVTKADFRQVLLMVTTCFASKLHKS